MPNPFPSVCLVDHTGKFSADELTKVALALLAQLNRDVSPPPPFGYGLAGNVHASQAPQPYEWELGLFSHPDQPGALGYHDQTPHGQPLMKVFPFIDPTSKWSTIASHELIECLVDPNCCKAAQSPIDERFWAYEAADACEQDSYLINDVLVSDFVLPPYYESTGQHGQKLDFMGLIKKPLGLRPGGYGQFFESGKGWTQVFADRQSAYRSALAGSRAERRRHGYAPTPKG